ncbi:hypothetical protein LCGC14_2010680 [marine sediment metagenome]|uniref:Metallo-beta-lactamase domain-containing protein n=1 Tax=marine sediment metagenome TaxID=412755 RepID=A0A0F9HDU4_9ZZZZ
MTKLNFIGTGSAFVSYKKNWQSNVLVSRNGKALMIDLGGDARHALEDVGLKARDIDSVFLTHFHADHIGSLEWLAFCTYFDPTAKRPKLYVRDDKFAQWVWGSIRNGVQSIEHTGTSLESFFELCITDESFEWEGLNFEVVQTMHTMNYNSFNPSYGLRFDLNGKAAFFSGDTQFAPSQYMKILEADDIIFHDCETSPFESGVHSYYKKLFDLPEEIKKKIWLYHYDDKPFDAVEEGFQGWIERGQMFEYQNIQIK